MQFTRRLLFGLPAAATALSGIEIKQHPERELEISRFNPYHHPPTRLFRHDARYSGVTLHAMNNCFCACWHLNKHPDVIWLGHTQWNVLWNLTQPMTRRFILPENSQSLRTAAQGQIVRDGWLAMEYNTAIVVPDSRPEWSNVVDFRNSEAMDDPMLNARLLIEAYE